MKSSRLIAVCKRSFKIFERPGSPDGEEKRTFAHLDLKRLLLHCINIFYKFILFVVVHEQREADAALLSELYNKILSQVRTT